jgi:hypothetical protein
MMNTVRSTFRLIITASLLLSLSMTGLYPRIMAGDEFGASTAASQHEGQGQRVCCCGTKDGRCCGKACCQLPNPKEDKAPTSPRPSEDRGQALGLAQVGNAVVFGQHAGAIHEGVSSDAGSPRGSSLIALSIRFNI